MSARNLYRFDVILRHKVPGWKRIRLVVVQACRLTLMGLVVGLVASFAASRLIASMLFDVSPTDVVTFVAVPVLLAVSALAASYLPARRATRIDPMVALRYE